MAESRPLDVDDAIQFLVGYLRAGRRSQYSSYGYELYLSHIARDYLKDIGVPEYDLAGALESRREDLGPAFLAAAWELARRGILRPGLRIFRGQATDEGASGLGYAVTPYGRRWLAEAAHHDLLPVEPSRFAKMLADAGEGFGTGFIERAQEAQRAYNAHAFLACCAMCGAAAESITLALAVKKKGAEKPILDMYGTAQGRGRVENFLLGGQPEPVRQEVQRYTALLKYWRDSSAHGKAVRIQEPEAYQSLALLLRFALFARDHWDDLTA